MDNNPILISLKSVSSYLNKQEKRYALMQFFLLLFSSILDVIGLASIIPVLIIASTPKMIGSNKYLAFVYNLFNFQSEKAFLVFLVTGIFVFFLVKNVLTTWINYKQLIFTAKIAIKISKRQFDKVLNLPYWKFTSLGSPILMNYAWGIPGAYVANILRQLYNFFSDIVMIAVIIIGILLYQPLLFVLLIIILVPSGLLTYTTLKDRSDRIGRRTNDLRPISHKILLNTFIGFVELKLAGRIDAFKNIFIEKQEEVQSLEAKTFLFTTIPGKVIELIAILGIVSIFLYAILFPEYAGNLITLVGLFAAAAYRLMPTANRLVSTLIAIKGNLYTIQELNLYKEFDKAYLPPLNQKDITFNHEIRFDNISFGFPETNRQVLNNIDIIIKKGEKIGFIGISGSGKTTLMNLLLRFYIEQSGKILVDGVPLTEENLNAWYKIIGYVKQDTFLMEGSIKENITLGDPNVTPERLNYALKYASLVDFVNSLPDGIDTEVGERGGRLSGGQRQRVGIARALYKKAEILVLDEATSALDTMTEREVSEAIYNLSGTDKTIFIIAHRITTLRDCDRIYELKDGEVTAEWQYEDLIKTVI